MPHATGCAHTSSRLLDIPTIAEQLNTSVRHIRRLVAEHRIPVVRVGRLIRFDPVDISEWLDELLPEERRPTGVPSTADFLLHELPPLTLSDRT